jgi:uncharacterized protein YndB with AHSA1/START domain
MLTTVIFAEESGKTRITLTWVPINATQEERSTFETGFDSMNKGWGGTFEQLANYLAQQPQANETDPEALPSREITITRIFDAPPDVVFNAWTDPKQLAKWWGPKGFTNPICQADARVGGKWHIVMRAPDGNEYPCGGVYREIDKPHRLVFTNIAIDKDGNPIIDGLTTVLFDEHQGKTKLTLQTRGTALVAYAAAYLKGMETGWSQSIDRLAQLLGNTATAPASPAAALVGDREIAITRIFDAPRELVFKVWTDPHHIGQWWGPNGFTTTTNHMEVKPGGTWRYVMHGPDGRDYKNLITYLEVAAPDRLVYKHGGGDDSKPVNFHATVLFDDEAGKTKLTMRMVFPSASDRDCCVNTYGAVDGLTQTTGRLADYVKKLA